MRSALLLATLAGGASAAMAQDDTPVGGVGRLACTQVIGMENTPYLGQAGDWALGYMAGRIDAGQVPADSATLSPQDGVDVVTGLALRCRETPDMAVIDAVRGVAERIFDAPAEGGEVTADPPPPPPDPPEAPETGDAAPAGAPRPQQRPEDLTPEDTPTDEAQETASEATAPSTDTADDAN